MRPDARHLLDDRPLARTLALLHGGGEEARVVGGAIRNALLGIPVQDYDIATTAEPPSVIARATAAGLRTVPTGIAHGTVTIVVDGRHFEVTTLREDIATDGRHATIRFGRDFAQDARRRDFTINALSMGPDGHLYDYAGGLADIAARRVRFIGDPATRIREDYLRILRFFRFSATYADTLDEAGLAAAIRARDGLARLSRERVRQELMKLLMADRGVPVITAVAETGLLGLLLPSIPWPARLCRLLAVVPDAAAMPRLAALSAFTTEDALRLRERLRLSNADAARIEGTVKVGARLHGAEGPPCSGVLRALLFEIGRQAAVDGLALAWAESQAAPDDIRWRSALHFLRDTPEPRLPFSGADLIARGFPAGRPLGDALKRLQANWIRAGFPEDPRRLADLLAEVAG